MLGLLVIIVISWLLLHVIEKKSMKVLGILPTGKRIIQFLLGTLFIMLVTLLNIYVETIVLNVDWKMQTSINYQLVFDAFGYHIKSALTEDLVFRGAILYILISRLGVKWGILISALCFGVYHVFSYGMTEAGVIPILYVILITGFTGFVWAYIFHKTKSIMLGLGLHLGINLINVFFFESQPYGELFFEATKNTKLEDWNWLWFNLFKGLFPSLVTLVFVRQYLRFSQKRSKKI
ncbi:CPBP family intramembrane glutamic endopeptidase [Ichthyenterobacterium sp. W332]|uniref:CPBP family intramembrane glutamic endopeptidase n=1 Tax=Microcosmobacter mediterraneus TaxID=3075607 RepID=A0ABU2YNJ8_9FLAO|nr:CPBP family intramembrane glutamic endopeptidase [Ichthyenterobacterium sp. W332]MDT0559632.1 CPBP family intramembrane glutamic endopeptidase [Ichthyenterobacterium sp. W332]